MACEVLSLVTAAGVAGMFVLILIRFGRVRCCAGLVSSMATMTTMTAVHEEMASNHQGNEAVIRHSADGHIEDEDRNQRGYQTQTENPGNRWNTQRAIGNRGMRFHIFTPLKAIRFHE